jgi:hypothetical protein
MALHVRYREEARKTGTGQNKRCPYCEERERTLVPSNLYQITHQPSRCPAIALTSSNEAVILETLRERCRAVNDSTGVPRKVVNKLVNHCFLVGGEGKKGGGGQFRFDGRSLLRHATQEELSLGQHINGLRLNRARFLEMRRKVYETMTMQLGGPLFDTIDTDAASFVLSLGDMCSAITSQTTVRSLLYDECGQKFLASKFDPTTRRPLVGLDAEERLFFQLESAKDLPPNVLQYMDYSTSLLSQQREFLAGPFDPSMWPQFT